MKYCVTDISVGCLVICIQCKSDIQASHKEGGLLWPCDNEERLMTRISRDMRTRGRILHDSWRHCHPECFCTSGKFLCITMKSTIKRCRFPDGLETFQVIWKLSKWSGNFPNGLETFRMVWKLSGWSLNLPDCL